MFAEIVQRRPDVPRTEAKETVYLGHHFVYPAENLVGAFIEAGKGWDRHLKEVLEVMVPQSGATICEVGSNIGASLLQMAQVKPEATFLAFEPAHRFRQYLDRNLRYAGVKHATIFPLLVGRTSAPKWIEVNTSSGAIGRTDYGGHKHVERQFCYATTLDRLFGTHRLVDLIKIDTDGYEFEVLRGGEETLRGQHPVLHFELTPRFLGDVAEELTWLNKIGYRDFVCLQPEGRLIGVGDGTRAAEWAWNDYCDVITAVEDTPEHGALFRLAEVLEARGKATS